eukprot:5588905-Amphidinium_carterae.1
MSRSRPAIAKAGKSVSPVFVLSPPPAEDDDDFIIVADLQAHPLPTRSATAPRSGAIRVVDPGSDSACSSRAL